MDVFDERFWAFLAVVAVLIVTPGPDTALVTRNALLAGRRAASLTAVGIGLGTVAWAAASVLGVAVLLERSALAFTGLKLAGAAYLCYLGVRSLIDSRRSGQPARPTTTARRPPRLDDRAALKQGLVSNLLNPKLGAFFVLVFPQFVGPGDDPLRLVLMLLAYEVILLVWLTSYGALISRAVVVGPAGVRRFLHRATGAILIALGIRLAFAKH